MKKIVCFMFALCMTALLVSCSDTKPVTMTENSVMTSGICGNELTWYLDEHGTLTISGKGDMWDFSAGEDSSMPPQWIDAKRTIMKVVIEDGVTSIGRDAFHGCCNLLDVELPDSISSIGSQAFCNTRLARIEIPKSMTVVGAKAFWGCENLEEVVLHDEVTELQDLAFSNCNKLTALTIPKSVVMIETGALSNNNIEDVYYKGSEEQWKNIKTNMNADTYDEYLNRVYHYESNPFNIYFAK